MLKIIFGVLSIAKKHGFSITDKVLSAGVHETLGNASMNMNDVNTAIDSFHKADKSSSVIKESSRFKIDLAVAYLAKEDFPKAISVLNLILDDENIGYSDKNKAEELIEKKVISGGMIPKINNAINVANKVRGTVIISGKKPHAILFELLSDKGSGTLIKK